MTPNLEIFCTTLPPSPGGGGILTPKDDAGAPLVLLGPLWVLKNVKKPTLMGANRVK